MRPRVLPYPSLRLPRPDALPFRHADFRAPLGVMSAAGGLTAAYSDPSSRERMRVAFTGRSPDFAPAAGSGLWRIGPPTGPAHAEQVEHDRYFSIERSDGDPVWGFTAGLVQSHLTVYENCLSMGVTLLDSELWETLFSGPAELFGADLAGPPPRPADGWRGTDDPAYDPAARWQIGHQLFFVLIQGSIIGLNCFAAAGIRDTDEESASEAAEDGLALAATFLRASAAAMRFASDFAPDDYDRTVRPDMTPPKVRAGFSGFQTRDHAHLVRLLGALKPLFGSPAGQIGARKDLLDAVVSAYAAHEFVCARFRGDTLPSLRMAAASRGKTERTGVEVVRELMRKRLALVDPADGESR